MAATTTRRPLPALAFLVGLLLLTSIVWWRVLHRSDHSVASASSTCVATSAANVVPQPSAVTVHVLNSTDRAGLARATGDALTKVGFNVPDVGNDPTVTTALADVGEIRYGPAAVAQAKLVSFYLPGAKLVPSTQSGTDVTISLGAKFTAVTTAAAASAAMQTAHVTQAPAPSSGTPGASGASKTATSTAPTPSVTC